jgi:predicted phosphodiesterase
MRILAISDARNWSGYEKVVDQHEPDVIVLVGDLASDGFADFWWEWKSENRRQPMETRKRIHVDRFYQFLQYAGRKARVLVVKGNHDEDFENDYSPERISNIQGCQELSGKATEIDGIRFLGLGFTETRYLRLLNPLIKDFKEKADIILTHGMRLPLISSVNPKLIIKGGFGIGKCLVNQIPTVLTAGANHTIIRFEDRKPPEISQYVVDSDGKMSLGNEFGPRSWFSKYEWARPYPEP